ncbi:hypothetical protein GCM10027431_26400 [Lysobacter rhizosphaerae]
MSRDLSARAFTVGQHIFFGRHEFQPDRNSGRELIAHELTHTIQQGGSAQRSIQRDGDGVVDSIASMFNGLSSHGVVQLAIDTVAPSLSRVVKLGGFKDVLVEQAASAVESVFDTLKRPLDAAQGIGEKVGATLGPIVDSVQGAGAQIARNDCTPLRSAAEKIEQFAMRLITPAVELMQPIVAGLKTFLDGVWKKIGAPIVDWIKEYASEQWRDLKALAELVQKAATWLWDKTSGLREPYIRLWNALKDLLGIGDSPDGRNGILQWVEQKLTDAWNGIKARLQPYTDQLKAIGIAVVAVLAALSPVGPILALGAAAVQVGKGIAWVAANWGKGKIMATARIFIEKTLIPPLVDALDRVSASVTALARSISTSLTQLADSFAKAVAVVGGTALGFLVRITQWLADQIRSVAEFATTRLASLRKWLVGGFDHLTALLRKVMNFLGRVADVVLDIYGLPVFLGEAIWNAVPKCIRDPIVDFLGPIILRQIELFSELVKDDEAWKKTKQEVERLITLVFHNKDLMGAIKAAFFFVLRIFNLPPDLLTKVANKALSAWDAVVKKPLEFLKSTIKAIAYGFKIVWDDKLENIKHGLQEWLLGEIKDKNIIMPKDWTDLGQIFEFVLSVLGISVERTYELMKQRFSPEKIDKFRAIVGKVQRIMQWVDKSIDLTKSPKQNAAGMLKQAKDFGLTLLESGAEWIIKKVAAKVTEEIVKAAATAGFGAILSAAQSLYAALLTAKKWMRQVLDMADQALDNVMDLVGGAFEKVGGVFAGLMKRGMPVVIGFLADQVGLGDVGREIGKVIEKLRAKVDTAILWLIDILKAGIDFLIGLGKSAVGKIAGWLGFNEPFQTDDGEPHNLYIDSSHRDPQIVVASDVITLSRLLEHDETLRRAISSNTTASLAAAKAQLAIAEAARKTLIKTPEDNEAIKTLRRAFKQLTTHLAKIGVGKSSASPKAHIDYSPMGVLAGSVTATRLSKASPRGTPPQPHIVGWTHVKTFDPEHRDWVKLHLVSEAFGGLGTNQNLVPAHKGDNSWMDRGPESTVKAMLKQGLVVHYKVAVTGYYSITDPDSGDPVLGFPTGLTVQIGTMKKVSGEWKLDTTMNLFPKLSIPKPPPKGTALVDMKRASYKTLRWTLGFDAGVAANISRVKGSGQFASEADFLRRMRRFYRNLEGPNKKDFESYIEHIDRLLGKVKGEKAKAFF